MGPHVQPITDLGQLMEVDSGSLTSCTLCSCCRQALGCENQDSESRERESEIPTGLLELARGSRACMEAKDNRLSGSDTTDATGCIRRVENWVGAQGRREKSRRRELAGSLREESLTCSGRWLGLVEALAGKVERPSVGDWVHKSLEEDLLHCSSTASPRKAERGREQRSRGWHGESREGNGREEEQGGKRQGREAGVSEIRHF